MRFLRSVFPVAGLLAVTALSARAHAQGTPPAQGAVGPQGEVKEKKNEQKRGREGHPAIRSAMRHLQLAKSDLNRASHDFGGHRVEALKSVDEALMHLRLALQADKK
ncbi:MAG: hypothetical protein NVS1B4_07020 [Gemmatimonadaceae bacterium]